jgi:hypothetical protein
MKKIVFLLLLVLPLFCFSQKNKTYIFDSMTVYKYKSYTADFDGELIVLSNSKDTTLTFEIRQSKDHKSAELSDFKNNISYRFEQSFIYESVDDLKKFTSTDAVKTRHYKTKKKQRKLYCEYEKDTLNNQIIVNSYYIKDNIKVKDFLYFFEKKPNIKNYYNNNKRLFTDKYFIPLSDDDVLVKFYNTHENKINTQLDFVNFNKIYAKITL